MSLYDQMADLAKQVSLDTAPQPGQTTHQKLKEFHDALVNAIWTLSRLAPHDFNHPLIQDFIDRTVSLECHLKTTLHRIHIDEFMKNRTY